MKKMTALVRTPEGNLRVFRYDDYKTQSAFADELRGNGFRVLKIWSGYKSDVEVDEWEMINRK